MSGTFPASPVAASVVLRSLSGPTEVSIAHNLKEQRRTRGAQRYLIGLAWPETTKESIAPIRAHCEQQQGQWDTFSIVLPPPFNSPLGSWVGSPVCDGANQSGRNVILRGFTANAANVAAAGDLFAFADHTKVYEVASNVSANAAGKANVALVQRLGQSPANGSAVTSSNVSFTVRLESDLVEQPVRPPTLSTFALALREVY